jgi:hypothetical protein
MAKNQIHADIIIFSSTVQVQALLALQFTGSILDLNLKLNGGYPVAFQSL